MNSKHLSLQSYPAGTIISTHRGLYKHVGLLAESQLGLERRVISLNPGPVGQQVKEESLASFTQGKDWVVEPTEAALPASVILGRARSGQHPPYSWIGFNCEHFVRFAHGQATKSPQIRAWAGVVLAGLVVYRLSRS